MAAKVYQSPDTESTEIQELYRLFLLEKAPALIGPNRESLPLPESIYDILLQELTTQQAANLLGVSRPFLIDLLNQKEIPFHKTGTHRRIYRKDVMDYLAKRDGDRKRILDDIARRAMAEGDYDQVYVPTEGE